MVDVGGTLVKREYYYPYGGNRGTAFSTVTTKRFTGQYHESGLPGGEGLSFYNARWYDAQLGRFVSADTIVPDLRNPQDLNRMAYVRNNPLLWIDPTGHRLEIGGGPLWPTLVIFANGINQTEDTPAAQGIQLQEKLEATTGMDVYVPAPVYTSGSVFVDSAHVYVGAVTDEVAPGTQTNRFHAAAGKMNTHIDEAILSGELTLYPGQIVHVVGHSGAGAYVDDLGQYLEAEYRVRVKTITTLGSPLVNYNEALQVADEVTMITAKNDLLGWVGLYNLPGQVRRAVSDRFSAKVLEPQDHGHTGYGQNPEVIQYLTDLFSN